MEYPSFERFAEVVRDYLSLTRDRLLYPKMQLQRDLGMDENRCIALMKTLEARYGIALTADSFDLQPREHLFHSGSLGQDDPYIQTVFGNTNEEVQPLTLGQLCRAVLKELAKQS